MVELASPLSPAECGRRLAEAIDPSWKLFGSKPVQGSVRNGYFEARKRIQYRNTSQTHAFARISPIPGGSRVLLTFGMSASSYLVMALIGAVALAFSVALFRSGERGWAVMPLLMAGVCGFIVVGIGRAMAQGEDAFLTQFICETLDASVAPPPALGDRP